MAIFNFRAIGPVFIASVGNDSVNIYNDAYTPIDTADMNQINVLGISRGIYYNLLECDDPTGFAGFSEGLIGSKLKLGGADVSSSNPLPVQNASASPVDRSSTITAGGTAQVLLAANANRKGIEFFNNSVGSIWLNVIGTATTGGGSIEVRSGGYWSPSVCPVTAISVIGATTGQAFTCWEYA